MLLLPPLAPAGRVIVLLAPGLPLLPLTLAMPNLLSSHAHPVPPCSPFSVDKCGPPSPTAGCFAGQVRTLDVRARPGLGRCTEWLTERAGICGFTRYLEG